MHNVDIRNVSIGQMQYFIKVAEYRNITKAAKFFNLSQPTLSKKLQSLESQLDLQLFFRDKNKITLTPAGRYLYDAWKDGLQHIEDEIQYAHVLQTGQTKSLVIGCLDSFSPDCFLLPLMNSFRANHPDVRLRLESDAAWDIRRMLIQKEADIIFSIYYDFDQKELGHISWKMLGKTPHCACMKKTNPLAKKEVLSVEDLSQSDFICISPQYLPEYVKMLHELCSPFGFSPNITNYVSSANSLTLNIQTDRDIFVCDKYYADLNSEEHRKIPIAGTESGFVMAWRNDNDKPYLQKFINTTLSLYEQ